MKSLVLFTVLALLIAGLLIQPATPQAPAKSEPERAEWRPGQTKHWRSIILRKD